MVVALGEDVPRGRRWRLRREFRLSAAVSTTAATARTTAPNAGLRSLVQTGDPIRSHGGAVSHLPYVGHARMVNIARKILEINPPDRGLRAKPPALNGRKCREEENLGAIRDVVFRIKRRDVSAFRRSRSAGQGGGGGETLVSRLVNSTRDIEIPRALHIYSNYLRRKLGFISRTTRGTRSNFHLNQSKVILSSSFARTLRTGPPPVVRVEPSGSARERARRKKIRDHRVDYKDNRDCAQARARAYRRIRSGCKD